MSIPLIVSGKCGPDAPVKIRYHAALSGKNDIEKRQATAALFKTE